jgi:hypothetical protein
MRDQKELRITTDGLFLEGIKHPITTKELSDSMVRFCEERHHWRVVADSGATASDFKPILDAALIRQPCKGLLHFKTEYSESWVMPLIPISRNYYSLVYAHQFGIGLALISGMLPPINIVHTPEGLEYVRDDSKPKHVAEAWIDDDGRCLVPIRKTRCVDTLEARTRYVRLGQFDQMVDTLWSDSLPKNMSKKPLTVDVALRAQFHVLRSLKGSLAKGNYYHLTADSTLNANRLFDRISSFRRINIDFNTFELR